MRIDRVFAGTALKDFVTVVRRLLLALDNNLSLRDNFGKTEAPAGHVATSQGPDKIPVWAAPGSTLPDGTVVGLQGPKGDKGDKGDPGEDGAQGEPGTPADELGGRWEPLVDPSYPELLFAYDEHGVPDLVMAWVVED